MCSIRSIEYYFSSCLLLFRKATFTLSYAYWQMPCTNLVAAETAAAMSEKYKNDDVDILSSMKSSYPTTYTQCTHTRTQTQVKLQ